MTVSEIQRMVKEYNALTNSNLNMVFVSFKVYICSHTPGDIVSHQTVNFRIKTGPTQVSSRSIFS